MPPQRPTILDLARETGLSKTTISDALTGRGRVSATTRDLVTAAAERLGYTGNRAARSLRSSTTGAIGLYIPPTVRPFAFYMDFAFGATHAAAELDVDLLLVARDPELTRLRPPPVDGVVVVEPTPGDRIIEGFLDAGTTLVTAGRLTGPYASLVSGVVAADHRGMARAVTDRLAAADLGEVAFIGNDPSFESASLNDMTAGYLDSCSARGVEPRMQLVPLRSDDAALREAASALLADPAVGALVAGPQGFAARVAPVVTSTGRVIGEDFAMATLAHEPAVDSAVPGLTAVSLHGNAFGREAVGLLGELLSGEVGAPDLADSGGPVERRHEIEVRFGGAARTLG